VSLAEFWKEACGTGTEVEDPSTNYRPTLAYEILFVSHKCWRRTNFRLCL